MIGTCGIRPFSTDAASAPFISGIAKSKTIKSGLSSVAFSTASPPSLASPQTINPAISRNLRVIFRISSLSSTTRIRLPPPLASSAGEEGAAGRPWKESAINLKIRTLSIQNNTADNVGSLRALGHRPVENHASPNSFGGVSSAGVPRFAVFPQSLADEHGQEFTLTRFFFSVGSLPRSSPVASAFYGYRVTFTIDRRWSGEHSAADTRIVSQSKPARHRPRRTIRAGRDRQRHPEHARERARVRVRCLREFPATFQPH